MVSFSFFFQFFGYQIFGEIWPNNSKISQIFTWVFFFFNLKKNSISLLKNGEDFARIKNTGSWARQELGRWARRWTLRLVRNSGIVLKASLASSWGGWKWKLQWQTDVRPVPPSKAWVFSACQGLWKIAGRSASLATLLPSCVCAPRFLSPKHYVW